MLQAPASSPSATAQQAGTWREQTSSAFALKVFSGGHFSTGEHVGEVAATATEGLLAGAAAS